MAIDTKLEDVQVVQITVPNGQEWAQEIINHNLKDQDGNDVEPDTVIAEIIAIAGSTTARRGAGIQTNRRSDGGPWVGLLTTQLSVIAQFPITNASGDDWVVSVRLTSILWHSMQGSDHTV